MPFGQAKQHIEKKIAPQIKESKSFVLKAAYDLLLEKFDSHTKKASKYIGHATYNGHEKDKQDYLKQIQESTKTFLKKEGGYNEFLLYSINLDIRSDKLHKTIGERIKQQENKKYDELSKKNINLVRKANFDEAINNMLALHMHLSPFNRTDKGGNIGEAYLRVDKKIEEAVIKLKKQKHYHSKLFVKGNVLETRNSKIYIQGTAAGGQVMYADIKDKQISKLKNSDYKNESYLSILRKFPEEKFILSKGGKNIDIKIDPKLAESDANIQELKLLKQINFFYSGGLEKFAKSPAEKMILKNALEENLATMSLYFDRNADGTVGPTKIYKTLTQSLQVKQLMAMLSGFQRIRMRMSLEEKEKKETDPDKVNFLKAEIDFQNGLHLSAYGKFRFFINKFKKNKDEAVKKQVKHAKERLKESSKYVISLAQRYSMACIQEPNNNKNGFHLSDGFRKKVIKKLKKVFDQLRANMHSGKAANLKEAYAMLKDKPEGEIGLKYKEFGARGNTEYDFLKRHYSFVKTMITTISPKEKSDEQEDALHKFGKIAREDKYRGGARVLFEETMKRKLIERRRKLMKDPAYREKNRNRFWKFKDNRSISFKDFEKLLEVATPRIPALLHQVPGVTRVANEVADTVTDLISPHETFIDEDEPVSKYEDYSPFEQKNAGIFQRAFQDAGGYARYEALPLAKKKEFYEAARLKILIAKHENKEHETNVKGYVKGVMSEEGDMSQSSNPVAYDFNKAFDPNNEFFTISDEGWDFVEGLIGEIPIMAASAGAGELAKIGVQQGAKWLVKRTLTKEALKQTLKSAAFRLGVRGTSFVADLAISEIVDRTMRYIARGENPPLDISQLLAHSLGTYGSMKYTSQGGQKLLAKVAEQGMVGKIASHAISIAALEAPCMMGVNALFGQSEGSILEQYGRALGTMLASKASMSMLHGATGRALFKADHDYETRDSVNKIKDPKKRNILNKMVDKGEISVNQLGTILSGNLSYKQIKKIKNLISNPKSVNFVLAYEYAKSHGVDNPKLLHEYGLLVGELIEQGLSSAEAKKFLKGMKGKAHQAETYLVAENRPKHKKETFKSHVDRIANKFKPENKDNVKSEKKALKMLLSLNSAELAQLFKNHDHMFKRIAEMTDYLKITDAVLAKSLHEKLKNHINIKKIFIDNCSMVMQKYAKYGEHGYPNLFIHVETMKRTFPEFSFPIGEINNSKLINTFQTMLKNNFTIDQQTITALMQKAKEAGLDTSELKKLVSKKIDEEMLLFNDHREFDSTSVSGLENKLRSFNNIMEVLKIPKNKKIELMKEQIKKMIASDNPNYAMITALAHVYKIDVYKGILSENPFSKELPSIKHSILMADALRSFKKITVKDRKKLSVDELHKKILKNMSKNQRQSLSLKQRKLIQDMLIKYKSDRGLTDGVKEMSKQDQTDMVRQFIEDASQGAIKLKGDIDFDLYTSETQTNGPQLIIYISPELSVQISKQIPNWDSLSANEKSKHLSTAVDGFNCDTAGGLVTFVNRKQKGVRDRSIEVHEATHYFTKFLGIRNRYKSISKDMDLRTTQDYKKFIKEQYQYMLQLFSDETMSFTRDAEIKRIGGVVGLFNRIKNSYKYTVFNNSRINKIKDPKMRAEVQAYRDKLIKEIDLSTILAVKNAAEIIKYPNGFNILQTTNVIKWGEALQSLRNEYGEFE
ncbi:hypothetical protein ACFL3T_02645 [Patescibacteria group bacterium]